MRNGDMIVLDVAKRRLDVDIPDEELNARPPAPAAVGAFAAPIRGWEKLYVDTVGRANTGADLDSWSDPAVTTSLANPIDRQHVPA